MGIQSINDIPAQLVQISHGDMLGGWLPVAIADIYSLILAYATNNKQRINRIDILEGWGFDMQNVTTAIREQQTESAFAGWL